MVRSIRLLRLFRLILCGGSGLRDGDGGGGAAAGYRDAGGALFLGCIGLCCESNGVLSGLTRGGIDGELQLPAALSRSRDRER